MTKILFFMKTIHMLKNEVLHLSALSKLFNTEVALMYKWGLKSTFL